jgi:hypothetical protein
VVAAAPLAFGVTLHLINKADVTITFDRPWPPERIRLEPGPAA